MGEIDMLSLEQACTILRGTKPKRRKRDRHQQRDELQHRFAPLLDVSDRDKFEQKLNAYFRL